MGLIPALLFASACGDVPVDEVAPLDPPGHNECIPAGAVSRGQGGSGPSLTPSSMARTAAEEGTA